MPDHVVRVIGVPQASLPCEPGQIKLRRPVALSEEPEPAEPQPLDQRCVLGVIRHAQGRGEPGELSGLLAEHHLHRQAVQERPVELPAERPKMPGRINLHVPNRVAKAFGTAEPFEPMGHLDAEGIIGAPALNGRLREFAPPLPRAIGGVVDEPLERNAHARIDLHPDVMKVALLQPRLKELCTTAPCRGLEPVHVVAGHFDAVGVTHYQIHDQGGDGPVEVVTDDPELVARALGKKRGTVFIGLPHNLLVHEIAQPRDRINP